MAAFLDSWRTGGSPWDRWIGEVERLRTLFAASIGADADEVAVMPSASTAIGAVATALDFDTDRRSVVLGSFEFPTAAHVWLAQRKRGAEIRWAGAMDETLPVDRYASGMDERTLVVAATHVCFRNGYRVDVPALVAACRARGAYVLLDDYQSTGTTPMDVHALDVDVLVTGTLKYLIGSAGIAFLYVRRPLIDRLEPLQTGWFGRVDPFEFAADRLDWSPTARRFETGTPGVPAAYAAAAGLELLATLDAAAIERRIDQLVARFIDGARARGFELLTPVDGTRRGALVVVRSSDPNRLVERLAAHGVIVSARGPGLRISFHAYNHESDVDAALEALDANEELLRP